MASRRSVGVVVAVAALFVGVAVVAVIILGGEDHGRRPDDVVAPAADADGSVSDAVWSADGSTLYVADDTGIDVLSGSPLARTGRIDSSLYPVDATWSPDHTTVVLSDIDGHAEVWDLATGDALPDLDGGPTPGPLAWAPDGERIATTGTDGRVTVHDVRSGEALPPVAVVDSGVGPIGMAWVTPDRLVAVNGNVVTAVDVASGEIVWRHASEPEGLLAASPDGSAVVVGLAGGEHDVFAVESGEVLGSLETESDFLKAADWSPDGRWVLAAGDDERPTLWDADAAETVAAYPEVGPYEVGGAWSPDAERVAVPDVFDQRVLVIDPTGVEDDEDLSIAEDEVISAAAWSPRGGRLAAVGREGTVFVWEVTD